MLQKIKIVLLLWLLVPVVAFADLTGTWQGNDGGTYYLRQVGNTLYWYGEPSSNHPNWSNVYQGRIHSNRINGSWADVPKGHIMNHGNLNLEIRHGETVLVAVHKTGGFSGSRWTRAGSFGPGGMGPGPGGMGPGPGGVGPGPGGVGPGPGGMGPGPGGMGPGPGGMGPGPGGMGPGPGGMGPGLLTEDCVSFNPNTTTVQNIGGRWKIVDGSHMMFDFGGNKAEALKALQVIKHYHANQSCFVGRPNPSFTYLKSGGSAPLGAVAGEDCIGFNPASATVQNISGSWKIVDGSHWMFDFGGNESEARQSLRVIKHYGFNHSCFVGRPHPSFSYLRR
jgi:hypothetical protein